MLVGLVFLVYWPGLSGGFVLDDFANIVDNSGLVPGELNRHFWSAIWSSGSGPTHRPIAMLTFALQALSSGMTPWPMKFVNVLIHAINSVLLFILTRELLRYLVRQSANWLVEPAFLAFLIALVWALSPMQLTAVLYVVQRMESLSVTFMLLGLLAYWHGRMKLIEGQGSAWVWIWGGLVLGTMLALLTKETGVILPLYALLIEWIVLQGRGPFGFERRLIFLYLLLLVLPGVAFVIMTLPSGLDGRAYAARTFDLSERLWTEGRILVDYLHWLVAPALRSLSLYHDDIKLSTGWLSPWTTAASWALIAALIAAAVFLRKRLPLFAVGILWFFGGHVLVSSYLPLELAYEHRNYLPSWGTYLAVLGLFFTWRPKDEVRRQVYRTLGLASVGLLITTFAIFTFLRALVWGNPYKLDYFEATQHPLSPRANYALGLTMVSSAPSPQSVQYQIGKGTIEMVSRMPNASIQADQALIYMAVRQHKPVDPALWTAIGDKLARRPVGAEDASALYSLVNCGIQKTCTYSSKDTAELGRTLVLAVRRNPHNAAVLTLYANYAANLAADYPLAYRLMQKAVALAPGQFNYWHNLVPMLIARGDLDAASASIERLRELNSLGVYDESIRTLVQKLNSAKRDQEAVAPIPSIDSHNQITKGSGGQP